MKLELATGKFYRVKSGQQREEIEQTLSVPAGSVFAGAVIEVCKCDVHVAAPFETYKTIAEKYGKDEEEIKNFNGERPLYPSRRIFIPRS